MLHNKLLRIIQAHLLGFSTGNALFWKRFCLFCLFHTSFSLQRLVLLAHAGFVIEQFYEDAKQECGFDHYQGRSWEGLHRHLALVMLAYSFLMLYRLTLPLLPGEAFSPLRDAKLAAFSPVRCCFIISSKEMLHGFLR